MTTNERLDEIQSRLSNIEARFNNMDTRFNNLDSHLNNIEDRLTNSQLNNPDAITQLKQQLDGIEGEFRRAEIRDIRSAWLTFTVAGFGLVSAAFVTAAFVFYGVTHGPYMLGAIVAALAGLVVMIIGYCGAKFLWWFPHRFV